MALRHSPKAAMDKQRILVVEDDPAIRRGVVHSLRFNGYDVAEAADEAAGRAAAAEAFDLLLLDLNLPGGDGLEILRAVRERSATVPVIILTARGDEGDRVKGLKLGADDYVVKPFGALELLARIEAVLRRSPSRPADALLIPVPGGVLDLGKRELRFEDGGRAALSEREAELLAFLARNAGRAISRDEILAQVWRLNPDAVETRTVDMHITRLRAKLRDDAAEPRIILTLRGRGYAFADGTAPAGGP
jgi:DNA-binding response OmpR family regulator